MTRPTTPHPSTPTETLQSQPNPAQPVPPTPAPINWLLIPQDAPLPAASRLIVLVPDLVTDEAKLASHIWALASPRRLDVLYLGLCHDLTNEARARRRLANLAAITRDARAHVQTRLELGSDWMQALQPIHKPNDLVICHAEQVWRQWGLVRQPLGQHLQSILNAPIYVLSGFYPEGDLDQKAPLNRILSWVAPLAILIIFFWFQIKIDELPKDWAHQSLLYLSVLAEIGLIAFFHYIF